MEFLTILFQILKRAGFGFLFTSLLAGATFLVCNVLFYRLFFWKHKIQPENDNPKVHLIPQKLGYELGNMIILSITGVATQTARMWLEERGILEVQTSGSLSDGPTLKLVGMQFALYFVLFDIYYYFAHRFLFHSRAFWWIHRPHHVSLTPNPFTGFSFSWAEVILTGGFPIALNYFVPLHKFTLIIIPIFGLMSNLIVHSGYEVFPWMSKHWATKWWLGAMFHDVHHQKSSCNYGGFTTIWDNVFGTVYKGYDILVDELQKRVDSGVFTDQPVKKAN